MPTITYYFNSYKDNSGWTYPGKMVDNNLSNFAIASSKSILTLDSNTCTVAAGGRIYKVELRMYGKAGIGNKTNNKTQLRPIFADGEGDNHLKQWTKTAASWSDWYDITSDTNAPKRWSWDDVINLKCYHESIAHSSSDDIAKVEIRVSYSECDNCDTFLVEGESYSVYLTAPIWGGEDNKISKDIDRKSFWSGNYDVNDNGIVTQPLVLRGFETAECDTELCGIAFEGGAYFSLYFNMGFTNKMRFMIEMADNNEEVTISGLGDCMDGVYIIKTFHYNTVIGAINTYAWNMTLEKVK